VTVNEGSEWSPQDPAREREWLQQLTLINSGLIIIGVYMVQPFLTAASLDLSAMVCVVAFSAAIPLLATPCADQSAEIYRRRVSKSVLANYARVAAQNLAFVGVVAGFWHIHWIAGVAMLATVLAGVAVYGSAYTRLERDQKPPQEGDEPGDTDA
jgi:hypothetical protein